MKKWFKKVATSIKEDMTTNIEIVKLLFSYPVIGGIFLLLLIVGIYADFKGLNPILAGMQLIGTAVVTGLLLLIVITIDSPFKYIRKILFLASFWFLSVLPLADFSEFNYMKFLQIVTTFIYIFLGCLLPDFISQMSAVPEKSNKE